MSVLLTWATLGKEKQMNFYLMLILLVCSIVGWSRLITGYGGPLDFLNRLRDSLLPIKRPLPPAELSIDPTKIELEKWQMEYAQYNIDLEMFEDYADNHPDYAKTLKGTLHGAMSCNVCTVPYLAVLLTIDAFILVYGGLTPIGALASWMLIFFGTSGLAILINEKV